MSHVGNTSTVWYTIRLMDAWDSMYPPDSWECTKARRIAKIQGDANEVTEKRCAEVGL